VALGVAAALLAPAAALVRWWRARRRGSEVSVGWEQRPLRLTDGRTRPCFDLRVDAPLGSEAELATLLTDAVVRLAEALRRADDTYHQVVRPAGEAETLLRPAGSRVQALGERFHLGVGQRAVVLRTQAWLCLPAGVALAEVADPLRCDPDGPGQPEGLLSDVRLRWGVASAFAPAGPAVRFRLLVVVPEAAEGVAVDLLERLLQSARAGELKADR
jgi:hypothetical protein